MENSYQEGVLEFQPDVAATHGNMLGGNRRVDIVFFRRTGTEIDDMIM